jgi:exo-beta-1,3-glucanase (GH17 family)
MMIDRLPRVLLLAVAIIVPSLPATACGDEPDKRFPLFAYLTGRPAPALVTYTPSQLDPRQEANQRRLATSSIRADLEVLRTAFDGLILYGYHEAGTPRILAVARELKFRAILLAVWDPKSAAETDGVAELVRQFGDDFAFGVLVGNEGIHFHRYEADDVKFAAARLRSKLPRTVPLGTSEPLADYETAFVRDFGDFLAPNIHPVFDRPKLDPAEAAAWARKEAARLTVKTKKPVILKETGFPHGGMEIYTPESQKAFWTAYLKPGVLSRPDEAESGWTFHGVAFEAFDLPWKSEESKLPLEKSWGLLSPKREAYPALAVWRGLGAGQEKK